MSRRFPTARRDLPPDALVKRPKLRHTRHRKARRRLTPDAVLERFERLATETRQRQREGNDDGQRTG